MKSERTLPPTHKTCVEDLLWGTWARRVTNGGVTEDEESEKEKTRRQSVFTDAERLSPTTRASNDRMLSEARDRRLFKGWREWKKRRHGLQHGGA